MISKFRGVFWASYSSGFSSHRFSGVQEYYYNGEKDYVVFDKYHRLYGCSCSIIWCINNKDLGDFKKEANEI